MAFWRRKKGTAPGQETVAEPAPPAAPAAAAAAPPLPSGEEPRPTPPETPASAAASPAAPDQSPIASPAEASLPAEVPGSLDAPPADHAAPGPRRGLLGRLAERLGQTREKLAGSIDRMTLGRRIDEAVLDELEEVLVTADLGVKTSLDLIEGLRGQVRRQELKDAEALKAALRRGVRDILAGTVPPPERAGHAPHVILVVGVNGVGKTTSIGKLARHFRDQGRQVLLAACDTFRAAAGEQLTIWAERVGVPIVVQQPGADPSAVAYDAVEAALARGRDLVLIDTAGRLHTKVNLMEELKKIHRVVAKRLPGAPHETLLVLDATTGQNALAQARLFHETTPLSGVVLTKLDGTAKGGIVVAIAAELKLPVLFAGLGEKIDDLKPFDPEEFSRAIF